MIDIVKENYYVGVWFLGGQGADWMCVMWRTAAGECRFTYRFRYYADPTEVEGFNPFDARDEKNFYVARWDGRDENEVIAVIDHIVDDLVAGDFCGTQDQDDIREMRHKDLCRGDGDAFKKLLLGLPYVHLTTPEEYAKANPGAASTSDARIAKGPVT